MISSHANFVLQSCRYCDASGNRCATEGPRGEGIAGADFVFYVSSTQTERCNRGATVAYAAHCQQESAMDRLDDEWDERSVSFLLPVCYMV